jgi:CheY-like chemotaxis protein
VFAVGSGQDALAVLLGSRIHVDLILVAVALPGMTGIDLHSQLETLAPDLAEAVVFMTEGVVNDEHLAFLQRNAHRWVEKPLDLRRLRRAFQAHLGTAS